MPITLTCEACGKLLRAPDTAVGKRVRCPSCQNVLDVPAGAPGPETYALARDSYTESPRAGTGANADGGDEAPAGERRPCPMCGERIAARAAKCRFCGEVFDPTLRRLEKRKRAQSRESYWTDDTDLTPGNWVLAFLCTDISCIVGIIWLIQGKPKGGKLIGAALVFMVIKLVIYMLLQGAQQPARP
jgi:predicted RNA-binding Zn-ribbon protein involved in translation (DUF1610 family)